MKSYRRKQKASRVSPKLQLEQLEMREMLAADLQAPPPLVETAAASASNQPTIVDTTALMQMTSSRLSIPRPGVLVIPVSAAEPRTIDGTNNNVANPDWGSVGEQLLRVSPVDYADGISEPGGEDRPSAREISNTLVDQGKTETANDRDMAAYIYVWGQFIDHDMDLTEPPVDGKEAFNIPVPADDTLFDPGETGEQTIGLSRSRFDATTGTGVDNPRQQINEITAWIDGSMVYGSDPATADSLRTFVGGKLLSSDGTMLPTDAAGNYLAGDVRANENVELTAMHTLWMREHNWWAEKIARANPNLTDEQIFQQARTIVIAEIQAITFNQFLPALLGTNAIGKYQGYDPTVNPSIANEFSTAAFRLGHSLINDDVEFFDNNGRATQDEVALKDAFFNPAMLAETGIDGILKYLASTRAQELDNQIVESLRNFLFGQPGQGGFDLASLNIQRGRDHGLADYNSVREAYGLARVESFADISSDPQVQAALEKLYGNVDNIDFWVGALAEDHVPGASVGQLVQTIVADQFERLRDGDRFWYQNIFSGRQLAQLQQTSLSDILKRNTTITNVQQNVFFLKAEVAGQVTRDVNFGRLHLAVGVSGATVELLNDGGEVIDSTVTDARGRYSFTKFDETGDYQVRTVAPDGMIMKSAATLNVLVSRGDMRISNMNFRVALDGLLPDQPTTRPPWKGPWWNHVGEVDNALGGDTNWRPIGGV